MRVIDKKKEELIMMWIVGKILNRREDETDSTLAVSPPKVERRNGGVLARESITAS